MVLQTLESMGAQHGYAIGARLEQVSDGALQLNMGTLYPALSRLEQRGLLRGTCGHDRIQPQSALLRAHRGGPPSTGEREAGVGSDGGLHPCRGPRLSVTAGGRMHLVREWLHRLRGTLSHRRRDADLEEELRLHTALAAEEGRRRGHAYSIVGVTREIRDRGVTEELQPAIYRLHEQADQTNDQPTGIKRAARPARTAPTASPASVNVRPRPVKVYGFRPHYSWTLATVSLILAVVSAVACLIPAHRASRIDPSIPLQHD